MQKPGRNDPCPCGSGQKYKKCCEAKKAAPKKINAQLISSGDTATHKVHGLARLFQRQGTISPSNFDKQDGNT